MKKFTKIAQKIFVLMLLSSPAINAQDLSASLADDLTVTVSKVEETKNTAVLNKKIKLTNLDNGKSVTVRINDRVKDEKVAVLSKSASNEAGLDKGKMKIKIQEMEVDDEVERFWASSDANASKIVKDKEVSIETTKLAGFNVNHIYDLKGNIRSLDGYGLQLAAFAQLKPAKEFADKLSAKGQEQDKIFIQVSKSEDKPMVYRVLYGFFEQETAAKETQKQMVAQGYQALVKGFN
jgi:cell division septation protein DedD